MRLTARLWVPFVLALALVAIIGGIFLWQINSSIALIEQTTATIKNTGRSILKPLNFPRTGDITDEAEALSMLRQGEVLLAQGMLSQAQDKLAKSVELGGGAPALRKLVQVQLQRRHYDEARSTLSALKKESDDEEDLFLLESLLELRSGNTERARNMFQDHASEPSGQYGLALIHIKQKENDAAKTLLTTVAQSNDPTLRTYARTILNAFDEFALFPEGQPMHLTTLLGRALAQVNECEIALPLLSEVVLATDGYRDAWIVKGFCEFSTERFSEALISLERSYNLDPEKPEIQYFLARTYYGLGDPQNAVTFLQYAIVNGFQPEREARDLLATYAKELGNTDLALDQYRALTEKENSDISSFEKFILLAITIPSRAEDGYQLAQVARSKWPDDASTLALLAESEIATGRIAEAQAHIDEALNIDPTNDRALKVQGVLKSIPDSPDL